MTPALPPGPFDLIMADPPWHFDVRSAKGDAKSPQAKYSTLSLADISDLPVARVAATDCLLWLWACNPLLPQALGVLQAWGFTFKTAGTWLKRGSGGGVAFGTGYILRSANEPFLIGTRGSPRCTRATRGAVVTGPTLARTGFTIEGLRREHSRKPDEGYAAAEALMPGARRLDLFSRETRPGWTGWGLEAGKFDQEVML